VSAAGDVNDDGIDDIIIGASSADPNGNSSAGESYVVFGSTSGFTRSLDLSSLNGANGFIIPGIDSSDNSGTSVSASRDVNGDGIDDIIIGAPGQVRPGVILRPGESYVVFGSAAGFAPSLDLSDLNGADGFIINGIDSPDRSGSSVSASRDVNGDGIDDIIIGASSADPNGNFNAGESYVVFGSTSGFTRSLDLSLLNGEAGFIINGIDSFDESGGSVSRAGDVNGDDIDDIIIGARFASPNGNESAGESYVVYGNASPTIDLNTATLGIDFTTAFTASPVPITANLNITDNNSTLSAATITITNLLDSAAEILTANTDNTSITANYNPINGTLTLTGRDTIANYQQVLQSITYNNTIAAPDTTARIIEFVVDDGGAFANASAVATTTLNITANTSVVDGTPGRDTLSGTPINDRIAGSFGADNLTGGGGNNVFAYNSIRDAGDTITDFQVGADVILLSRSLFQAPSNFNYDIATTGGFLGFRTLGNDTTILIDYPC
jgi:Ca2+-binding RTX toxin-like protein